MRTGPGEFAVRCSGKEDLPESQPIIVDWSAKMKLPETGGRLLPTSRLVKVEIIASKTDVCGQAITRTFGIAESGICSEQVHRVIGQARLL
jgi:hypothetical protein